MQKSNASPPLTAFTDNGESVLGVSARRERASPFSGLWSRAEMVAVVGGGLCLFWVDGRRCFCCVAVCLDCWLQWLLRW